LKEMQKGDVEIAQIGPAGEKLKAVVVREQQAAVRGSWQLWAARSCAAAGGRGVRPGPGSRVSEHADESYVLLEDSRAQTHFL
jgi:aldehyde:ferredoxin oxidoreductase